VIDLLSFDKIERRIGPIRDLEGSWSSGPQLYVGNHLLANNLDAMDWHGEPVQFKICDCWTPGCASGGYFNIRKSGDLVMFVPAFANWDDDFGVSHYAEPELPAGAGSGFMTEDQYDALRAIVPDAPSLASLQTLAYGEAMALWYFEAPAQLHGPAFWRTAFALANGIGLVARDGEHQGAFDRAAILCSTGDDEDTGWELLNRVVSSARASAQQQVNLTQRGDDEPLCFILDLPGYQEWPSLVKRDGCWHAVISPGFTFALLGA